MAPSQSIKIPLSILVVGSGAFGLSTAWALCRNTRFKDTSIIVVDRQPFPTPDCSSVSRDFSVIIATQTCLCFRHEYCPQCTTPVQIQAHRCSHRLIHHASFALTTLPYITHVLHRRRRSAGGTTLRLSTTTKSALP